MLFAVGPLLYIYMKVTQYISINIYRVAWFQIPCCITFAKYNQIWSMKKASSGTSSISFITSHILNASSDFQPRTFGVKYFKMLVAFHIYLQKDIFARTQFFTLVAFGWCNFCSVVQNILYKISYTFKKKLNNPPAILLYVKNLGWYVVFFNTRQNLFGIK